MDLQRDAAAGTPKKDEDIVPDEYFDPPHQSLIHNNQSLRCRLAPESMGATGRVSASSVSWLIFPYC